MGRQARIFVQNNYAGLLEETDQGYRFSYDAAYLAGDHALPVDMQEEMVQLMQRRIDRLTA